MSHKSQEKNMRKLAELLGQELSYIWGENESGPNGAKKQFLNTGRTFLRALGKTWACGTPRRTLIPAVSLCPGTAP